tara:strand:+ start:11264 stop:12607 length:1344 start_codon:yes stop_codon:yes gene_type:complete
MDDLENTDQEILGIINKEGKRIREGLEMIPSENFASKAVLQALGNFLNCKYSEGYAGKRYYGGNEFVDEVESIAIERAKKLFGVPHANVQPYSGSPANLAVYFALCSPGDTIMGHDLPSGGHLTHGWKASVTGQIFNSVQYHVKPDGYLDLEEIKRLAKENKPKLIWVGATAYVREFPFEELSRIADSVGAYLIADISHIAGLVVGGAHKSPAEYAHIITTTSHKTLRGPRGAIIMVTQKGLDKDSDLAKKIDKSVFPGLQGGPHNNQTAAMGVALKEASTEEFKDYAHQIVKNSKELAKTLMENGVKLVSNGTDNHMCLIDLTDKGPGRGVFLQEALEEAGITVNKNTIPNDPSSPFYPSGVRLGVPAITTRGMKEEEMRVIGKWISEIVHEIIKMQLPSEKEARKEYLRMFREALKGSGKIRETKLKVKELSEKFPLYPGFNILK